MPPSRTMEPDSKAYDPPPPYEDAIEEPSNGVLEPAVLLLQGETVVAETALSTSLYKMNGDVTSLSQNGSSIRFERAETDSPSEKIKSIPPNEPRTQHIFYLVHPVNAQYRDDIPAAYYITSASPDAIGNICFETSKPRFQKTEFKALLSAKKTASDNSLFDPKTKQQHLFNVKPKWKGGGYKWTNSDGNQLAFEDGKGDQHKLVVTASMKREMRDALVAMWVLKLWHDTAESRQAKRETLENLMPVQPYPSMKQRNNVGALGAMAGAGGGGF